MAQPTQLNDCALKSTEQEMQCCRVSAGVNLGVGGWEGAQAPPGLAIAPPRFIPKALRNGKV